jgi:hypothetical protein
VSAAEVKGAREVLEALRGTPDEDADRLIRMLAKEAERPPSDALLEAFAQHYEEVAAALRARVVERREGAGES